MIPVLFNALRAYASALEDTVNARVHSENNDGYRWLLTNFPHLTSQADSLTQGWTIVPESIVRSANVLRSMLADYRTTMNYGAPESIPVEQQKEFLERLERVLDFLEDKVLVALERKPEEKMEVDDDAFAEAFAEDDAEPDVDGPDAEDRGGG